MKFVVVALLMCFCLSAVAQDWTKLPEKSKEEVPFRVGDNVAGLELHNMLNYSKKTWKISDHKVKLILLDFWETSCGPCIKFWPTALKLQQEFAADLQIVPVNKSEGTKEIKDFLAKRKRIDGFEMNLPMSCRDSTTWKRFPISSFPCYVWIGEDGKVGAITGGQEVTRENIKRWIDNGPFKMNNLSQKKFYYVNPREPIFVNANGGERPSDVFLWSSSLTKGQDDNGPSQHVRYDSLSGYGITIVNSPIIILYGYAYNYRLRESDYLDFLTLSRMELIAKDSSKYYWDGTLSGNAYNYQLISDSPKSRQQLFEMMQHDLQRYFGLNAHWEKRTKKCLVFTMFDSTLTTKTKSLGAEAQMRGGHIILDSLSVKDIMTVMEIGTAYYRTETLYPIIDETGYKGIITGIREKSRALDPVTLNRIFSKHGLHLKFEMREVDVLVLREPD